jgi:hypothetical protein
MTKDFSFMIIEIFDILMLLILLTIAVSRKDKVKALIQDLGYEKQILKLIIINPPTH